MSKNLYSTLVGTALEKKQKKLKRQRKISNFLYIRALNYSTNFGTLMVLLKYLYLLNAKLLEDFFSIFVGGLVDRSV